jgi:hypothetical protein
MTLFETLLARIRLRGGRTVTRAESIAALAAAFTTNGVEQATVALYLQALRDIPERDLQDAVMHLIDTQHERWFPTIATIRALVFQQRLALPTPEHAWELIQNEAYRQNAPAAVGEALKGVGGTWALRNAPQGVVRGQFIQQYRDTRQRAITDASAESRAALGAGATLHALPSGGGDDAA